MRLLPVAALTACAALAFGQKDGPKFDVASIKATDSNPANPMFTGMSADGAMVNYTNITLRDCIRAAYRLRDFQIEGPDWLRQARYQIQARLPAGVSADQIPEMLQALLAERFKLRIRRESKQQNVYVLTAGKDGPKLKPAQVKPDPGAPKALGPDGKPREPMMYGIRENGVSLSAPSASLAGYVEMLSRFTARPIVDATGIQGQYEFDLFFSPEVIPDVIRGAAPPAPANDPAPSIFDAIKKYGLRLEARKAPVQMLVVAQIERTPVEN